MSYTKSKFENQKSEIPDELIASWGAAKLYKDLDGNLRLEGGSEEDRAAAERWIEIFGRQPLKASQSASMHRKDKQK